MMLLHSPLVGVESWGRLPEPLGRDGVAAALLGLLARI